MSGEQQRYALIDGGDLFLFVAEEWGAYPDGVFADGVEMERVGDSYDHRRWWRCAWASEDAPAEVRVTFPAKRVLVGAKLEPEYEALAKPHGDLAPELSEGEWRALLDDESPWVKCYEAQHRDEPVEDRVFAEPLVVLRGQPPQPGPSYYATLPHELREHKEYLHLFPGHLHGFVKAAEERVQAIAELDVSWYPKQGESSMYIKVRGGSGYVWSGSYRVKDRIAGENRAEALDRWESELDRVEADVRSRARVCPTCKGTGKPRAGV